MHRLEVALTAYAHAFRRLPPEPYGVKDEFLATVLEHAVAAEKPIPDDFDWWPNRPDDALG